MAVDCLVGSASAGQWVAESGGGGLGEKPRGPSGRSLGILSCLYLEVVSPGIWRCRKRGLGRQE